MMMRSNRKPPLPKSPARLLTPRRVIRSTQNTAPSPPPASLIKTQLGDRNPEEIELRPEYRTISYEIQALAKMVRDEFGKKEMGKSDSKMGSVSKALFERGKFYEEYAAMRNERLKRKRGGQTEDEKDNKIASDFNESEQKTVPKLRQGAKRKVVATPMRENRGEISRRDGVKREVVSTPMRENQVGNSRYMLRSMNKENKKPPLPVKYEDSAVGKLVTRRARKI